MKEDNLLEDERWERWCNVSDGHSRRFVCVGLYLLINHRLNSNNFRR